MKKNKQIIMITLLLAVMCCVSACGKKTDTRTVEDIIKAYTDKGLKSEIEEQPFASLIGAVDGAVFYMEDEIVKLYQYETEEALEEAIKADETLMKDWPVNGRFVLETKSDKAKEIFEEIK